MLAAITDAGKNLRATLGAGVLWIAFIWVCFSSDFDPHTSDSSTASFLKRTVELLGQAGSLVVLLMLAVALGGVSRQIFRAPAMWVSLLGGLFVRIVERLVALVIERRRGRGVLRRFGVWEPVAVDLARRMVDKDRTSTSPPLNEEEAARRYRSYDRRIAEELLDPESRSTLTGKLNEQAELEFALVIPLLATIIAAAVTFSWWFLILVPLPFVAAFQAAETRTRCYEILEPRIRTQAAKG